jgi:antimicrobial peptide system SdpA family protein
VSSRERPHRFDGGEPRLRRIGIAVIATVLVWCVLVLYGFQSQGQPIGRIPLDGYLTRIVEQGWRFFSRSPREPATYVYVGPATRQSDELRPPVRAGAAHAFGINRATWAQGNEIDDLSLRLPDAAWRPCGGDVAPCTGGPTPVATIVSAWRPATICGPTLLLRARPVAWGQRGSAQEIEVVEFAKVDVRC